MIIRTYSIITDIIKNEIKLWDTELIKGTQRVHHSYYDRKYGKWNYKGGGGLKEGGQEIFIKTAFLGIGGRSTQL